MTGPSPTARTLATLAADGWTADIVERRITNFLTRDLFGVIDIVAIKGADTLAIQVTSSSNLAARVRKVTESDALPAMRAAGWRIECHGWRGDKCTVRDLS